MGEILSGLCCKQQSSSKCKLRPSDTPQGSSTHARLAPLADLALCPPPQSSGILPLAVVRSAGTVAPLLQHCPLWRKSASVWWRPSCVHAWSLLARSSSNRSRCWAFKTPRDLGPCCRARNGEGQRLLALRTTQPLASGERSLSLPASSSDELGLRGSFGRPPCGPWKLPRSKEWCLPCPLRSTPETTQGVGIILRPNSARHCMSCGIVVVVAGARLLNFPGKFPVSKPSEPEIEELQGALMLLLLLFLAPVASLEGGSGSYSVEEPEAGAPSEWNSRGAPGTASSEEFHGAQV